MSTSTKLAVDFGPVDRRRQLPPRQLHAAQLTVVVVMILSWQLMGTLLGTDAYTSSPSQVIGQLRDWYEQGVLVEATATTLLETALGFGVGAVAGAATGMALGWGGKAGLVVEPFVALLYAIPKLAIAPLFVLWFGIGLTSKSLFAAMIVYFLVFFTTFQGAKQVDRDLLDLARVMGAGGRDLWLKVAVPQTLLWVFAGLRLALPYALIGAVVAEFLAARTGLGYLVRTSSSVFNTAGVYAGIVMLMLLATVLLAIVHWAERRFTHWSMPSVNRIADDASA